MGIAAAMLAAAYADSALAYRTAADLEEFQGTPRIRLQDDSTSFVLHDGGAPGLSLTSVVDTIVAAFLVWEEPACSSARLVLEGVTAEPAAPGDGVNTIQWISVGWTDLSFNADAPGATDVQYVRDTSTDGSATADAGDWTIAEVDIYLNAEHFGWRSSGTAEEDGRDVLSVIIHEAGHALGLLHPCEVAGAADRDAPTCGPAEVDAPAMFPVYSPARTDLSQDDIAGLCFLYETAYCATEGCERGQVCTVFGCKPACGDGACDPPATCVQNRCVEECENEACLSSTGCRSDEDCPSPLACSDGACVASVQVAGDPCTSATDCGDLSCSVEGYCAEACTDDADCGQSDARCGRAKGRAGACIGNGKPLGAPCTASDECLGGHCLGTRDSSPVCTRPCEDSETGLSSEPQSLGMSCPTDWGCENVEGETVCVPNAEASSFCSVTSGPGLKSLDSARRHGLLLWLLLSFIAVRRVSSATRANVPKNKG